MTQEQIEQDIASYEALKIKGLTVFTRYQKIVLERLESGFKFISDELVLIINDQSLMDRHIQKAI